MSQMAENTVHLQLLYQKQMRIKECRRKNKHKYKKRSRLGNEKVVKLSYIYINSNLGNSIEDSTTTAITAFSKSHEINRIDYCSQQITHSDLNDYISSSEDEIE